MLRQLLLISLYLPLGSLSAIGGDDCEECTEGIDWTVEYDVYEEGPRTVYEGTARLYMDLEWFTPCMICCFDLPKGRLAGPRISRYPGEPMLAFDAWEHNGNKLDVLWCEGPPQGHPFTGEWLQTLPMQIPRHFKFYIIKTEFGPDDLTKLLDSWGSPDSPWDLNEDGTVGGADLATLLAGWKID